MPCLVVGGSWLICGAFIVRERVLKLAQMGPEATRAKVRKIAPIVLNNAH
jgi:hypothetical protein